MDCKYIDIHTHTPRGGARHILACSIGIDPPPPEGVAFSAGIHPWSAEAGDIADSLDYLETAPVVAIGEIGLDWSRPVDRTAQERVFRAQLDIATRRGLPVILHCVKAYNEVLGIIGGYGVRAAVFHGYTGSPQQTRSILDKGYYISAGGTSLGSSKTIESLRQTPLDRIFAETDTGDMDIHTVYARLSAIMRITCPQLAAAIDRNYKEVFE